MEKNYRVTTFVMDSGERYCMVVDRASGLSMYYPTLFLTSQIRNKGNAFSTTLAAANNLVMLLRFVESRDIDLEQRLLTKDFFKSHEMDDLRDFAQRKQGRMPSKVLSTLWLDDELTNIVDNGTQHSRLTTFANYLCWYAMHILNMPELDVVEQIKTMATQIKVRRPFKKSRNSTLQDRSLSDVQLYVLFETIKLESEWNPFSIDVQRRNRLMILLLFPDLDVLATIQSPYEFYQLLATDKLHIAASVITKTLHLIVEESDIRSERTGDLLHINSRRFRYTTGTRAAREGFGELVIAELLDHTDTQNAGVYIKNIPEHVKMLDEAVGFSIGAIRPGICRGTCRFREGCASR
nr:hypothetical protein [Cedecea lapagei]